MNGPSVRCSFVTFNVFADLPAFRHLDRRLEIVARAVAAERPDILALQELVRARRCGDMGRILCDLVNRFCGTEQYRLYYAEADGLGEDEWKFDEGIALMGRLQRASTEIGIRKFSAQVRLATSMGNQEYRLPDDRVAIHARYVLAPGLELDAYGTHLTDRNDQSGGVTVRVAQARELVEWIQHTSRPGNPILVGGDFNDIAQSETVQTLIGDGFIDLHAAAGAGPGHTNDRDDLDIEAPEAFPNQRIDYVFFKPGRGSFAINSVKLFLDRPTAEPGGRWLWASDHFGVLSRLEFFF